MSSLVSAVQHGIEMLIDNPKRADLKRDIVDCPSGSGLTTDHGVKISNTDTWYVQSSTRLLYSLFPSRLKASDGEHTGAALLEDQIGREKIHRFDHERIPERVVHARGSGAHGTFRVFDDRASKYTYAPLLTDPSRETPIFIRFSTVQGSRGSAVGLCISILLCAY